ncbi:expansin-like B1 [Quercus suber]|uniref:Expansin-like b1 n=1 Tax=Quercus suber TaxID=58331 RepID=A0AAW0LIJ1_QUESU|nr:expansin-like B1 [Quercus suber]POE80102.1 expansin-like b1 [Quercus suber]
MGFALKNQVFLLCVMVLLLAVLCYSQDTFTRSRATYYGSPDCYGTPSGACGFREFGRTVNDGNVAGVSRLFRNGTGCGACYQVRCTTPQYCADEGVNIVVTDYGEGDKTDFILSPRAYAKLARPNVVLQLFSYGVVDIEYRRISCKYSGYNLMFKVHESSNYPSYLAIVLIYVSGKNDITAVELWQEDCQQWTAMRRAYGAVWDFASPPSGPIKLRFQVSGSSGIKWVEPKDALPSDWKAGAAYDSYIQLT